jgi:hypothetical protein
MFKQVHEVGFNIGVRTREVAMKSRFEQLRFGVLYTHAVNAFTSKASYDSATLTFGYRFSCTVSQTRRSAGLGG